MFNLNIAVQKQQQLKYDSIHGSPFKRKQHNPKVQQTDGTTYEVEAEQEHTYMTRGFRNHSADFGRRLSKRRGQYHKPGGGFAGCTTKGI